MSKGGFLILLKRINISLCHMLGSMMTWVCLRNMCIVNLDGFNMEWVLEAQKKKHKQKKIEHLATSNELMGRCTIKCFIIVTK
jgi:hypothetical protein